jgi:hypothetical protein
MNIYRLSLFFTPVSFRWTIPLRMRYAVRCFYPTIGRLNQQRGLKSLNILWTLGFHSVNSGIRKLLFVLELTAEKVVKMISNKGSL